VWIHGGPNAHFTNEWYPYFHYLTRLGYVVIAPNCRGSTGYGRSFREDNLDFWGGRDTLDWRSTVEYMKSLPEVDGSRLAIWGSSYGGYATLIALSKLPDLFKVGICHYGPSDLIGSYDDTRIRPVRRLLRRQMGSLPVENLALWRDRSAINFVDNVRAPLLILQGEVDGGVHPRQSVWMEEALRARGKVCELTVYPGEGHGFARPDTIADVADKVDAFLTRYL
jgi:dipeptidyl aminopeptidase/acylaminoacyl peptidase